MSEKRVGMLLLWHYILKDLNFHSAVARIMGSRTWDGWSYGDMGELLLLHAMTGCGPMDQFLDEYAGAELLGKGRPEVGLESLDALFESYWGDIFYAVTAGFGQQDNPFDTDWELMCFSNHSGILVSRSSGLPLQWVDPAGSQPVPVYCFKRLNIRSLDKAFNAEAPVIGLLAGKKEGWEDEAAAVQPQTLQSGSKQIEYIVHEDGNRRRILVLEKQPKNLPPAIEERLQQLRLEAWHRGYDEGIFWLNRELKTMLASFPEVSRQLRFTTKRISDKVRLGWQYKESAARVKETYYTIITNLLDRPVPWIFETLRLRDEWYSPEVKAWFTRCRKETAENRRSSSSASVPAGKTILCWFMDGYLHSRLAAETSLNQEEFLDAVSRLKWRNGELRIPGGISRQIHRLFPTDED